MADATASPSPWNPPTVFLDAATNDSFSVQLQSGRPDTGEFDYFVIGAGDYIGYANLNVEGGSGNVKVYENVSDNATALFEPVGSGATSTVPIRLEGQILNNGTALTLNIWINGVQSSFSTAIADPTQAQTVAQQAVAALSNKDWATFYNLLAPEAQSGFGSEQNFAQLQNSANSNNLSAGLAGGSNTFSADGYAYFSQGVSLVISTGSGTANYNTVLYLVYESGHWYVLGTDPPSHA